MDAGDGGKWQREDAVLRRMDRDAVQEPEESGLDDGWSDGIKIIFPVLTQFIDDLRNVHIRNLLGSLI